MEKDILEVFKYFERFRYPVTEGEIYTFLAKKISKKALKEQIQEMIRKKIIVNSQLLIDNGWNKLKKYTPYQYKLTDRYLLKTNNIAIKPYNNFNKKYKISQSKINSFRFNLYTKLLSLFPQIKLVGLSGTCAMMNAGEKDDIDLFIITAKKRLFTCRFIALILAQILGIRRSRNVTGYMLYATCNRVCLNLFFDESNLQVPEFKKTEYVGHEILQMKPLIAKADIYQRFLTANRWVLKIFPNAGQIFKFQIKNSDLNKNLKFKIKNLGDWVENVLKRFQLCLIYKHRTSEIITDYQLWFHPIDHSVLPR